jgi:hypothetical protein
LQNCTTGDGITPYYQPAREVRGDFYDFLKLPKGRLGILVGDATGKGVPAALVMASARSMLRALAQTSNSPGEVFGRVNDPLVADIPANMFVTCFYAMLERKRVCEKGASRTFGSGPDEGQEDVVYYLDDGGLGHWCVGEE